MLTLDQILNESRWVAKMQGWRATGTYKELEHLACSEDCREIDLAGVQPPHLAEFFDLYNQREGFITIQDFYREVYYPKQAQKEMRGLAALVETELDKQEVIHSDVWSDELGTCKVLITWGDWKHEHARADYVVAGIGGSLLWAYVTEEDGSDCYSAVHKYQF